MMKQIRIVLSLILLSLFIVGFLFISAEKKANVKNGFTRKFTTNAPKQLNILDVKYGSYYFSGITEKRLFLGNSYATLHLLSINHNLNDSIQVSIPVEQDSNVNWKSIQVQVDSSRLYLIERKTPSYIFAQIPFKREKKKNMKNIRFDLFKVISPQSMIISYHNGRQKVLQKIITEPMVKKSTIFQPKVQKDGNFELDGFFSINKEKNKIFYTYYYINKFISLDTNMNFLYSANTIDTNTVPKIKLSEINHQKTTEVLMSAPPLVVSKRSYSSGDWMYINSALVSDGETKREFDKFSVIDIYSVIDGKYHYSIRIPDYLDKKITDFAVYKHTLFALYDHHLISYYIN